MNLLYRNVIVVVGFVLIISTTNISAQYYDSGQDPFTTNLKQIKTDNFSLIFPSKVDSIAFIYSSYLEKAFKYSGQTLGSKGASLPIVLHDQTAFSNGEVAWAPKRMNLYAIAPQDNFFIPWHKHLVLHETRHVMQISKVNTDFTKVLSYAFGQQIVPAIMGLHVPFWFLEGDAVAYETGATKGGRGTVPDFSMELKAQVEQKGIYSYPKAMFGSYKHFVPDHYKLGYYLISRAREKFGIDIWEKALLNVGKYPIHWNPFSASLKKSTGLPERKLYKNLMQELRDSVMLSSNLVDNNSVRKNKKRNSYSNYYNPSFYNDKIIALKTSLNRIPHFIIKDELREKKLKTPGYLLNNTFSLSGDLLVWNELKITRWANKNYNRIALYNIATKELKYLANKQKIYGSKLSNDGSKIVSVEVNDELKWEITIRKATDGNIIQEFKMDTIQPTYPDWSPNGNEIVFVGIGNEGKSLGLINVSNGEVKWILQNEKLEFSQPKHLGDSILLKGTYNNVSNFYCYYLGTKNWKILSNVAYGVGEGDFENNSFVLSDYTANGYKIKTLNSRDFLNKSIDKPQAFTSTLVDNLATHEYFIDDLQIDSSYTIEKYSRFKHLFNIHSWAPLAIRIDNQEFGFGATVFSQNTLSTSFLSGGYQYYWAQNRDEVFVDYEYKGFYPVINSKYSYSPYYTYDTTAVVKYDLHSLNLGTYVPFVFQRGPWTSKLQPEFYYNYEAVLYRPTQYIDKIMHNFKYGLYAYNKIMQSKADLYPKWGQSLYLQYQHAPFDSSGEIMAAQLWLYFPGLLNNHSLRLSGGIQKKEAGTFSFTDRITYPRGYLSVANTTMKTASVNYSFPLLYPDLNVWQMAYIKRLKTNLFYDYANYSLHNTITEQQALGVELSADLYAFRFVAPFELGVRYARKLSMNENFMQITFKINFEDLY